MNLRDIGEDALVARLLRGLPGSKNVLVGPGDDCAVVGRRSDAVWTLLKTDCVIEGVHFAEDEDFRRVGWKALARAVSDIAAMGGEPEYALITVALPPILPLDRVDALYEGLRRCARKFKIAIVGGETARSPGFPPRSRAAKNPATAGVIQTPGPVFISVALTGRVERNRCVTRSGGHPGDLLYVTGRLGGSLAGKHLDFMPRLVEARWLTEHFRLHAMMDLSDGLGADLPRLARASGCSFSLGEPPCNPGCSREDALSNGEDFELLFALSPRHAARLEREWPFRKLPLTRIGWLTPGSASESTQTHATHGFDHFA